mmetsp:Transcript_38579/g.56329  ORF Transcript_38579/g.56329 Transcript_38579/m.56329 type:complete len:324 (+) Transcript_38579:100-1071(+)
MTATEVIREDSELQIDADAAKQKPRKLSKFLSSKRKGMVKAFSHVKSFGRKSSKSSKKMNNDSSNETEKDCVQVLSNPAEDYDSRTEASSVTFTCNDFRSECTEQRDPVEWKNEVIACADTCGLTTEPKQIEKKLFLCVDEFKRGRDDFMREADAFMRETVGYDIQTPRVNDADKYAAFDDEADDEGDDKTSGGDSAATGTISRQTASTTNTTMKRGMMMFEQLKVQKSESLHCDTEIEDFITRLNRQNDNLTRTISQLTSDSETSAYKRGKSKFQELKEANASYAEFDDEITAFLGRLSTRECAEMGIEVDCDRGIISPREA